MTSLAFENSSIPSSHIIRAAIVAARVIARTATTPEARKKAYIQLPTGGLFDVRDLQASEAVLVNAGLVEAIDGILQPTEKLRLLLELSQNEAIEFIAIELLGRNRPPWLLSAIGPERLRVELIPSMDMRVLEDTIPQPERREAALLAAALRYDSDENSRIGQEGEKAVIALAKATLVESGHINAAESVKRVSLISDQLGYDVISPSPKYGAARIEVKTTSRSGRLCVIISRNEFEVGVRDPCWALAICRFCSPELTQVVGWCRAKAFASMLPTDHALGARWTAAELALLESDLEKGLPIL